MVGTRTYGRAGNFFFQAAMCISYALKHGLEFSLPNRTTDPFWNPLYLQHLVNPNYEQGREDILINELRHEYQEVCFKEEWRDKQIVLNGYWQTEKYFKQYRDEILYLFDLPYEKKEGVVAVHIRRGDYLTLTNKHPQVPKEWIDMCMGKFEGMRFKIFSDEIDYCRKTWGDRNDCEFSTNSNEIDDLIDISHCEHQICSASTFSFWGMWLNRNKDKKVIFPKLWFQPGWSGLNTDDIVPEWCIKL